MIDLNKKESEIPAELKKLLKILEKKVL